ncbi:MAG: hypothetical protein NTU98_04470 [Bacteroidetes bacterium]|nr:hypothetical protein [Bacteroidota bacterium]
MKTKLYACTGMLIMLLLSLNLWAQDLQDNTSIPFMPANSLLYGGDVIIDNQPTQDQSDVCLSVAFNGWLYAAYIAVDGSYNAWKVWISKDDGATWQLLIDNPIATNWYTRALDLVVCGTTVSDLVVYVPRIYQNDVSETSMLRVTKHNGNTGSQVSTPYDCSVSTTTPTTQKFLDVAIASDYRNPAYGASPYSIGVLYSKAQSSMDTIAIVTSSDGGVTFDARADVMVTYNYSRNVSLAYGRCPFNSNGRYFAVWEERSSVVSDMGMIYTAHSDPYFSSAFTSLYRLDDLLSHTAGFCRNPSISCQFNDIDNGNGHLTEVVLFDRAYDGNTSTMNVVGVYNKDAPAADTWSIFGIDAGFTHNDIQPDLNFDPGFNNFLATYCNQTDQKLRYLVQGQEMPDAYNWGLINDKYNDANNLINPCPKVEINPVYTQVAHVWNGQWLTGGRIATFDAEYSSVGTPPAAGTASFHYSVYPNPAIDIVYFSTGLPQQETVKISA